MGLGTKIVSLDLKIVSSWVRGPKIVGPGHKIVGPDPSESVGPDPILKKKPEIQILGVYLSRKNFILVLWIMETVLHFRHTPNGRWKNCLSFYFSTFQIIFLERGLTFDYDLNSFFF